MIRNVIFDWSGTLVDDLPAVWRATNHVFKMAGLSELTMERFRAEFCLPFRNFYQRFTPHVPPLQLEDWFHGHFREVQHTVCALPHAEEFLRYAKDQGWRTFVLSTVHADHYQRQATALGLSQWIDKPYVAVMDKREMIHEIVQENGLAPDETLFIGDMEHDVETAKHGGIHSCGVLTGYNTLEQLRRAGPDLIVEHLGELKERLIASGAEISGAEPDPELAPVVTVGALIFDDTDQVLMIRTHKWSDLWGIPGGKVKGGETCEDALRREIREETGLAVTDIEFVIVQDCVRSREFYKEAHFVLLNYVCRATGAPEVRLNEEAQTYRWVTLAETKQLDLNAPTLRLVEAVEAARKPAERNVFGGLISIDDLEVSFHVGVPDEERSTPQRLLITVQMWKDFEAAAKGDDLSETIDYDAVCRWIRSLGSGRSWRLIETLAAEIASGLNGRFGAEKSSVTVKKFIIPDTRHVAVTVTVRRGQ